MAQYLNGGSVKMRPGGMEAFRGKISHCRFWIIACSYRILIPLLSVALIFSDDAVTFPPIEGCTRHEGPDSVVFVPPGLAPGVEAALVLGLSEASTDSPAVYHTKQLKEATDDGLKIIEALQTGECGSFLFSKLAVEFPNGRKGWTAIYTTRWAGRGQVGAFICNEESAWHSNLGWVEATFIYAVVPNPLLAPGAEIIPILDLYFAATHNEVGRPTQKFLAFYKNGLALRVDALSGGFGSSYRGFGLVSFDALELIKMEKDNRVGKWTEANNKITVDWRSGQQEVYTRGDKVLDGPKHWTRLKSLDGARFDGTFENKGPFGPTLTLRVTKDGRFEADGINTTMGGKNVNPLFPEKGAGTYEVRSYSMIFRFDNGFRTSIALQFEGDDPARTARVILNGTPFEKN